jgi:hypothetical protein
VSRTPADLQGAHFQELLVSELQKLSQYYSSKASSLESTFARLKAGGDRSGVDANGGGAMANAPRACKQEAMAELSSLQAEV